MQICNLTGIGEYLYKECYKMWVEDTREDNKLLIN